MTSFGLGRPFVYFGKKEKYCNSIHVPCFRRRALQRKVQEDQVPAEEQEEMMRNLARRETEFMRLQRRKVGIDDFEQLTVIGKGAFGEVNNNIEISSHSVVSKYYISFSCFRNITVFFSIQSK